MPDPARAKAQADVEHGGAGESLRRLASRLLEEQRSRWEGGDPAPVEDYLRRNPELQADPEAVVDLIYQEVLLQKQKGRQLGLSDCVRRFPHYEAELRDQFELHELLETQSLRGLLPGVEKAGPPPGARGTGGRAAAFPVIAGYEIQGELGGGGMGVVYLAYDLRLKRQVAVKVIRGGRFAREEELARFRTEAEVIARLQHPNIVQIYEVGEHRDGPYLVLEYAAGGSLVERLGGQPQPAPAAAGLVETLARAIHHAHERGIVHRDLKPANVLLANGGREPPGTALNRGPGTIPGGSRPPFAECIPKISDFGLAKLLGGGEGVTASGVVLGTVSYLPPEQAHGKEGAIGPAADVYALGAILYELLTGRPPFRAESEVETVLQVVTADPVPPRQLQPRVPRDLETICLKCLEKKPGQRYASARALAEDLARFREGRPIQARPVRPWERALKWARRRRALAGLTAVTVGVALLGFGLVAWQWRAAEAARRQETSHRKRYQRLLADVVVVRGLQWCRQGDVGRGMLELVRGLEVAGDEAEDLQRVIRINLADWSHALGRLQNRLRHKSQVLAAALSPDGRLAVTACADKQVYFWDLTTGAPLGRTLRHPARVHAVAFSPDGKTVVTGTGDPGGARGAACLWDVATRRLALPPLEHRGPVWAATFAPDGKKALTGSGEAGTGRGAAQLWDAASGTPLGTPLPHPRPVRAVAFSPDGRSVLTGCEDRWARLWNANTRRVLRQVKHGGYVDAVAFSPDGQTLLTGGRDSLARLWDAGSGRPVGQPLSHQGYVQAVAFSGDGKAILTGSRDGTARLWDATTQQPLGSALVHGCQVTAVAFHPDGRTVLTGCLDRCAHVWRKPAGKPPLEVFSHPNEVWAAAFSPDGRKVATAGCDGVVRLWNVATGELAARSPRLSRDAHCVAFSPDGKTLLTGSGDKTARLWDAETARPLQGPFEHPDGVTSVAFSPDGGSFLTGCRDRVARLWDLKTRRQHGPGLVHSEAVRAVAFHPRDPGVVLTGSEGRTARLWDVRTGQCLRELRGHQGPVAAVAFSRDGNRIVTGSDDTTARLWDAATGRPAGEPLPHAGAVQAVAFSPGDEAILTASRDGAGRLWDGTTCRPLGMPLVHQGPVRAAAFGPDGRAVLTAGEDRTARLWPVPAARTGPVERIRRLCEVATGAELDNAGVPRPLDPAAWRDRRRQLEDEGQESR